MRRLALIAVALLAAVVAASFYIINIQLRLFSANPVIIYDPFNELQGQVVGNTFTVTLTGSYIGVPFVIVLPTKPLISSTGSSLINLGIDNKSSLICVQVKFTGNTTFSVSIETWSRTSVYDNGHSDHYHGFGLVGIAVPYSLFQEYGYNKTFPVAITVRYPTPGEGYSPEDYWGEYGAAVSLDKCTIFNSTAMNCTVEIWDNYLAYYETEMIWMYNTSVITIGTEKYFLYLLPKSAIEGGFEPFFMSTVYSDSDAPKYSTDLVRSNETISSLSSGVLQLCFAYVGGSVAGTPYPNNGVYPVFGLYLQISPDSLPAEINMTVLKIWQAKAFLIQPLK